MIVVYNLL